jgi:hypothetical protein
MKVFLSELAENKLLKLSKFLINLKVVCNLTDLNGFLNVLLQNRPLSTTE